jgi:predicted lipid-binding transport protein (Tim44 family)
MTAAELETAMSELTGRPCSAACLVQNRSRFFGAMMGSLAVGMVVGEVVNQIFIGAIVVAVLIGISGPLVDRRILGLDDTGVVQARAASFTTSPTALLGAAGNVSLSKFGRNPVFHIEGRAYLGATGSRDFATTLQRDTVA